MRNNNLLEQMYEDLVLDNQWSLAERFCVTIKQNQDNQTIVDSFKYWVSDFCDWYVTIKDMCTTQGTVTHER